jgi:3'(2'), 5'-bisphosphate nucleotidase
MFSIDAIINIAREAGEAIMAVYGRADFGIEFKEDVSPLTHADLAAHNVIVQRLKSLGPELPVLSEESREVPYETRRKWDRYWLVDPLDGTKEFIKRNDEFTVNIALIEEGQSVLGVVLAPALGLLYHASTGGTAFRTGRDGRTEPIRVSDYRTGRLKVAASRSHAGRTLEAFLGKIGDYDPIPMGSSLKFCLVAEGAAHFYPRFGTTMEWDTAAAHCVVAAAGGSVTDFSGKPLIYNKPDLTNPEFIVCGDPPFPWKDFLPPGRENKEK